MVYDVKTTLRDWPAECLRWIAIINQWQMNELWNPINWWHWKQFGKCFKMCVNAVLTLVLFLSAFSSEISSSFSSSCSLQAFSSLVSAANSWEQKEREEGHGSDLERTLSLNKPRHLSDEFQMSSTFLVLYNFSFFVGVIFYVYSRNRWVFILHLKMYTFSAFFKELVLEF